jgi:thioredoxin reductase (NADPH)
MHDAACDAARDARPVIMAVDDEVQHLDHVTRELSRRYGEDYRIMCERSPDEAQHKLEAMRDDGDDVAIVLADHTMGGHVGSDLLARVKEIHPSAKRGLLVEWRGWADRDTAKKILNAMALGHIDYYVLKPWRTPDELFHRTITEFLQEWRRFEAPAQSEIEVVAEAGSPRAHELTSLLARNGIPFAFHPCESERGRQVLEETGHVGTSKPIVRMLDGNAVPDPDNRQLAEAFGLTTRLEGRPDFDVVVVGAGPAGLAAAVSAASEGLSTFVIEREAIGGQAGSSSLIRNYLGFSRGVSGAELAQRAYQQAWVFGTDLLLMREVQGLRIEGDRHVVEIDDGDEVTARVVVLATGVSYRRLERPGLNRFEGAGVFYGASLSETQTLAGQDVYIVGGGNSAGQAAMHLVRYARCVHIVVRGRSLAESMSSYLHHALGKHERVHVMHETEVVDVGGEGRLEHITLLRHATGEREIRPAAALFVMIGARPNTKWLPGEIELDEWDYVMTGPEAIAAKAAKGYPEPRHKFKDFETCVPGVFAVGDLRHGAAKRVASAVGEGSVVVRQILEYLDEYETPDEVSWRRDAALAESPAAG